MECDKLKCSNTSWIHYISDFGIYYATMFGRCSGVFFADRTNKNIKRYKKYYHDLPEFANEIAELRKQAT